MLFETDSGKEKKLSTSDDKKATSLVAIPPGALSRAGTARLAMRGIQDLLAAEQAEQWLQKGLELLHNREFDQVFGCFDQGLKLAPNHRDLQYYMGLVYEWGHGISQDHVQAAFWYRKSAEQGLASAQNALAFAYECGRGVHKDDREAAFWYRSAADQGDADSQFMLAVMYREGRGVPYDPEQAILWFRKSADQGDEGAQLELGQIYEAGELIRRDYSKAAYWYLKAAAVCDAEELQRRLGYLYEHGLGVPKDNQQAIHWYRKAAEQGNEASKLTLSNLTRS